MTLALLSTLLVGAWGGPPELPYAPAPVGIVVAPLSYDTIPTEVETRFYAPLDHNGFSPTAALTTSWPVSGVAAPTVYWSGADPTGAGGISSHAFTLTGSTESVTTPFCNAGGWGTLGADCMTAQRFDGTNDYYTAAAGVGDPSTVAFTVWAVARVDPLNAATRALIAKKDTVPNGNDGFVLYLNSTGTCTFCLDGNLNDSCPTATAKGLGNWIFCGGGYDPSTFKHYAFANGVASVEAVEEQGDLSTSFQALQVGAQQATGSKYYGDLIVAAEHVGTYLSTAQMTELYNHFIGILDTKGAPVTQSNTGPQCCTVNGSLECFGDDMVAMGCEENTSGGPDAGLLVTPSATNSVVQSDNLAVTWTAVDGGGAAVVSTAATSPYRDGRAVSTLTDDQAGTLEYAKTAYFNITSLNAGDKIQFTVWAKAAAPTTLGYAFQELTGGVGDYDLGSWSVTTSWARYTAEGVVDDTANTNGTLWLCPGSTDCSGAGGTGAADVGAVGVWANNLAAGGQAWIPAHFCPTTTAAVTCGSQLISWAPPSGRIWNASGALVGNVRMGMRFAPVTADNLVGAGFNLCLAKDSTDYLSLTHSITDAFITYDGTSHGVSAVYTTLGTFATVRGQANYDSDQYWVELNGTRTTNTTADTSPTGLTAVRLGSRTAAATIQTGGFFIDRVKVDR
jgi:hypothetical protein